MKATLTLIFVFCGLSFTVTATTPFAVPRVTVLGNQTDPIAKITPDRDGPAVGTINNKIVWFYSDTDYTKDSKLYGFYDNTDAIGQANNPLIVIGPAKEAIPYTPTEEAYNKNHS
jgi:hypothetical protein